MKDYIDKYYPEIKYQLTQDNIKVIEDTIHYQSYKLRKNFLKLADKILKSN